MFLSLGHVMKHDERWADLPPPLSPECFNPDRCAGPLPQTLNFGLYLACP